MAENKPRSSYPLRLASDSLREEVEKEAKENYRSLNAEFCVLIQEAMNARKQKAGSYAKQA